MTRLEVLTEMKILNGSMRVRLLDLDRRKVSFVQELDSELDWMRLLRAANESSRFMVDAHDLEHSSEDAQFFVSEVRKRVEGDEPSGADRVVIVLSEPRKFSKGEDLTPISAVPRPGARVFYIRCDHPVGCAACGLSAGPGPHDGPPSAPSGPVGPAHRPDNSDSLERMPKPLNPRLFDVTGPTEFRHALAAIINEISRQN